MRERTLSARLLRHRASAEIHCALNADEGIIPILLAVRSGWDVSVLFQSASPVPAGMRPASVSMQPAGERGQHGTIAAQVALREDVDTGPERKSRVDASFPPCRQVPVEQSFDVLDIAIEEMC